MDWFSLFLDTLTLTVMSLLHIAFAGRFLRKRPGARHFAGYLLLLCAIAAVCALCSLGAVFSAAAELLALCGISRVGLKAARPASCAAALLAVYVSQLSFGIINSAEAVTLPQTLGTPLLYPLLILATLSAFGLCLGCYWLILRLLSLEDTQSPCIRLLLPPGLFFSAAELYIVQSAYGGLLDSASPVEFGRHFALLSLQVLGLGALLCTLYIYRHICRGLRARAALESLTQAAQAQKTYVAEAQRREEQTRSFRHDLNNHLSVLDGLLRAGRIEEAKRYLAALKTSAAPLSPPGLTGNPVIDILLGEKLALARSGGVEPEISLLLPKSCGVDDFDLCVVFANALDNAIYACLSAEGGKFIRAAGECQGDFYRLSFENSCSPGPLPPMGTGLSNIKAVAEKYHGAMLAEKDGTRFCLHVLLNISIQSDNRSDQMS